MKAEIKQIQGLTLAGKADSGHWIVMDTATHVGGADAATRPLELILLGLGGCTSMDIISILKKKRIKVTGYECHLDAERAESDPKIFTKILIKYVIYGDNIPSSAVDRAIELSISKYCTVYAMLSKTVEIKTEYEIRPELQDNKSIAVE
jgi:putative redox protein